MAKEMIPSLITLVFFLLVLHISNAQKQQYPSQEEAAFEALGVAWNPDGTLNRSNPIPTVPATPSVANLSDPPVALSMDLADRPYRLYRPVNLPKKKKLPLIINPHGGDFIQFSSATVVFHIFCNHVAARMPAVVVAVDYRHAPEHRLPAVYDDTLDAVFWAREQARGTHGRRHPWLEYVDFSKVFLLGSGAGGNAAFHTGLRSLDFDLRPLQIKGLLLNQPYFGGVKRMPSEIRLKDDPMVALFVNDVLWTLVLPRGLTRDHKFCNPISGGSYGGRLKKLPRVYVKGDYGDPLVDRSTLLVRHLRKYGVGVVYQYSSDGPARGAHGIEQSNATLAQQLYDGMKHFIKREI